MRDGPPCSEHHRPPHEHRGAIGRILEHIFVPPHMRHHHHYHRYDRHYRDHHYHHQPPCYPQWGPAPPCSHNYFVTGCLHCHNYYRRW
ncbi:unnamed protein product [Acanthoscelides obtectus]|uniref:Uncharacterized protein n=1 Tax=Acanthoscelides obtectus TaxID=200917 RepID=A0A9P0MK01_ACAOB|nr:unnamed protein product [Acanthoscelides obtectus]CAK1666758.1 hypothetical protein AOBTE_LOCUS25472 [Acanthoscelides obtectus]